MRWALAASFSIACSTQYGAYLQVEGANPFDRIELYFGVASQSDAFATPKLGKQTGTVFDRDFAMTDLAPVSPPATTTTYYVPSSDAGRALGSYVAVVAMNGSAPVGIGERFDFDVPSDAAYEYPIKLEPYSPLAVERWGSEPGCLAWQKARDRASNLVAVVHANDRDCDNRDANVDCNDLCTSGGSASCTDSNAVCASFSGGCALGCVVAGLCSAKVCIPPATCAATCASGDTLARLNCGVDATLDHVEVYMDVDPNGAVCVTQFQFNPGASCAGAALVYADPRPTDGVTFVVSDNGTDCIVDVIVPPGTHLADTHHLLIAFAGATSLDPRRSVLVGVQKNPMLACVTPGYAIDSRGSLFDCR